MIAGDGRSRLGSGDSSIPRRIPLIAFCIFLTFGVFVARLFQLQLLQSDELRERSQRNYVRLVRLEAPRGDIVDRMGRVLATTRPAFGVQVVPNDVREANRLYDALGMLIDRPAADLRERVGAPRGRERFQPVRLAGDMSYDQRARVEEHLYTLPGAFTDVRPRRTYVEGPLAAHVLGFIGEIQREQLETRRFADYLPGEVIGQDGIESVLQSDLRGRAGGRNLVVDVAGRVVELLEEIQPKRGGTVVLTLDRDVQRAAEDALLPEVIGGRGAIGAVVALDVRTGDVLAMASKPSYDPNDFPGGIDAATWRGLLEDEWRPIQNRAVAGQYPPGSTYKAILAAAGLEEGLIRPGRKAFCPGHLRKWGRTYRCWKRGGHGWVDLHRALVESCDVYFYELGIELGIDRLAYFAHGFNLGRRTGIRLQHEQPGLVPTSTWKERRFSEPWMPGETISASIGQGFNLVTPLQLAVAYAAIANGGKVLRPRLVLRSEDVDGKVTPGPEPEVIATVPVSPEHLAEVAAALEGVVHEPRGTGGRARVPGVRVAGKTGTAQVVGLQHTEGLEDDEITFRHRDHAWFAAFAPAEAPEIAVAVIIEHGGHGSSAAGPVAQRVLAAYLGEEAPDDEAAPVPVEAPAGEPVEAPATVTAQASGAAHGAQEGRDARD